MTCWRSGPRDASRGSPASRQAGISSRQGWPIIHSTDRREGDMVTRAETERREQNNRYQLRNRYIFEGQFEMETALHIGGGTGIFSSSDSPVVLTPEQQPFIPGSSFKGALRSTVEKIVPSLPKELGFSSCALI